MAPERYHSNILEPLTPPRTPCARLRTSLQAPQSLKGRVVREAVGRRAISAPVFSRYRGGLKRSAASVAGSSDQRVVSPSSADAVVAERNDAAWTERGRPQAHETPLPAHCEAPAFWPPEVTEGALPLQRRLWLCLGRTEAPTRAPPPPRAAPEPVLWVVTSYATSSHFSAK